MTNLSVNPNENIIACFSGDAIIYFEEKNIKVFKLSRKNIFLNLISILKIIKSENISTLHSHHRYFGFITMLISIFKNIKTKITVHSKVYGFKFFSYKNGEIIAVSNAVKIHLNSYFKIPLQNIRVEYPIFTKNSIYCKNEIDLSFLNDKINLLFVGRFCEEKGFDILLQAFERVSKLNSNLRLIVCGEGELQTLLDKYIQKGLNIFHQKPIPDLSSFYKIADVVILPSRVDPYPLVMLETIHFQKKLIASNVDGIPEGLNNYKLATLIPPNNKEELISAINNSLK